MRIRHHLDESTLMSLAAGSLPEALGAVAGSHLSLCGECRDRLLELELIGGALLDEIEPETMSPNAQKLTWARFGDANGNSETADPQGAGSKHAPASSGLPEPLADLLGCSLKDVSWTYLAPGVRSHRLLPAGAIKGDLRLLKIAPGRKLPHHGHGGSELTLVLSGSYQDELGQFQPGDIADLDDTVEHTPVADTGAECICLVASESQARFKGLISRTLSRLRGM